MVNPVFTPELADAAEAEMVTVGAVRSTTIVNACEATDSPFAPVAFAVTDFVPSVTVPNEQEKAPDSFAMHADPEITPPTYS
jgi:hypothetical protein